jgi:molybdopterin/thiamine biosynthesis adenylyltransferase
MAAAELVHVELRKLLADSEAGADAVAAGEADMPEPLSQHISADSKEVFVLADPFWSHELVLFEGNIVFQEKLLGNGFVLVTAEGFGEPDKKVIGSLVPRKPVQHKGRWVSLKEDALSPWPSREEVLAAAEAAAPDLLDHLKRRLKKERKRSDVVGWIGVTFMEEGPQKGQRRRGWVFLKVKMLRNGERRVMKAGRALAFTPSERGRRIPELAGLSGARALVVGAGSVGAPIAFELAKAGVGTLDICDYDSYDVNNAVRHVLSPNWAGVEKAFGVKIEAESLNPFIAVRHYRLFVGGNAGHSALLDQLLPGADVVIDATGSQSAARVLQRRCREFGRTLVLSALTSGSYGAEVAVFRPLGPCYYCFVLNQEDGVIPKPTEGPRSNVTPTGCSTPAFSGAGFDATGLAAAATRTAVRASGKSDYPDLDYDYIVMNFRGYDPWQQGLLPKHEGCPLCHVSE